MFMILKRNAILFITAFITILIIVFMTSFLNKLEIKESIETLRKRSFKNYELMSRDFFRYKCNDIKRIGGWDQFVRAVPNELFRTEGSWFVCFDKGVAPIQDKCNIISFGVNRDESFDRVMNTKYGCRVESFDPYVEHDVFQTIRNRDNSLSDKPTLQVNKKWKFHRIGVVGNNSVQNFNKIGWLTTFKEIIKYTKLEYEIIDVLKMDIENGEWDVLRDMDIDYLCKYVKQFMMETHIWKLSPGVSSQFLRLVKKLEKCYLLFRRDTRFYQEFINGPYGFQKTEFQDPKTYRISLNDFIDENDIINFMVTFGELYFVNENFIE